ncbi:MAG: class I SAM-dependent methyltransferase [Rhodospirillales bacterium]|nr:MAG: class I SAM-dependent methyltransferase [Rhodospirillales bacterium]
MAGAVHAQYEELPYPPRDPEDERKRLVTGSPSHILEIDHYLYAGARDWSEPFRVLVAGGGTGDALIMLAQQLADRGCPAEIHYLDLSAASRAIAERRAAIRGLETIRFHTGSLLDAARLGAFDYVDCCGVLHHLADPAAGFRALADVVKPDGGLGIMVYGELGRTGVYHAQEMLRMIAAEGPNPERVAVARRLVESLPPTNWLKRNTAIGDYRGEDAALFDLLLHAQDRPYRVPELAAELGTAGLRPVAFITPALYDPDTFLRDPELRRRLADLTWIERCAFAELLSGHQRKHIVYCVGRARQDDTVARLDEPAVPVCREIDGPAIADAIRRDGTIRISEAGLKMDIRLPPSAPSMLRLVDGRRTVGQICATIGAAAQSDEARRQFAATYRILNGANQMLLRYPAGSAG